ncbi:MAG TPA: hypothetical protein VN843_09285 [Anaerolineales bacterium]|nr:hypothetical protein [Anaerolineales bacterium]
MNKLPKRQPDPTQKNIVIIISILMGVGIVLLLALVLFLFRGNIFQALAPSTETPIIPTMFIPTPDCGSPTLVLGTATFQIQNITRAPDGSLPVPTDTSGVAYWVEGTSTNYVFVLSPTPDNLALMSTITVGSTAKATWKNCNSTSYSLSAPQQGSLTVSTLPDQSIDGITVFFQTDVSGAGFVFTGELTEEQISTINTPDLGGSEIKAEISLLETTTSADGTSIRIGVSIQNYGEAPFTLSASDISLTQQDGTPLVMASSEPPLPKEVGAGSTETIYFTFPRPASPSATLKIFNIEYDLEGY